MNDSSLKTSIQELLKRKVKLVIFDWDGTLLNSSTLAVESHLQALNSLDITGHSKTSITGALGMGREAACKFFTEGTSISPSKYYEHFREHYDAQSKNLTLFAESTEIVSTLRKQRIAMALATNKSRETARPEVINSGLGQYFEHYHYADQSKAKPHPKMLIDIMDQYNFTKKEAVMIGDQIVDIIAAKNAGISSITVYDKNPPEWAIAHELDSTFLTHRQLLEALKAQESAVNEIT